jgi:hypothetical protein
VVLVKSDRRRPVRILTGVAAACAVASMIVLVAMRRGALAYDPQLFACIAAAVIVVTFAALVVALLRRAPVAALFTAGLLLVYAGGMANFLFSLQGYALLTEFDHVALAEGKALQEFDSGPMSNLAEMDLTLQLEKLELRMVDGGLVPTSYVRILRKGQPLRRVTLPAGGEAGDGSLRFMQGAYGFAPRIVVTRSGNAVFDRYIPFTTRRVEGEGLAFDETFDIASEKMRVRSAMNLLSLDDQMKGHARLGVLVTRTGKELGRGELSIGHFAKLSDGSYIGYAGLKRWSEIDIARRNYPAPMYAGAALMVLSLALWPFARARA